MKLPLSKINRIIWIGTITTTITSMVLADTVVLSTGTTLHGIIKSQNDTNLEIQTINSVLSIPLNRVVRWDKDNNVRGYLKLCDEAIARKDYLHAKQFASQALSSDPGNSAIEYKLDEIYYLEYVIPRIQEIRSKIQSGDLSTYREAIRLMEQMIQSERSKHYLNQIDTALADIRIDYSILLYDHTWKDECYRQLRLARIEGIHNPKLHLTLAKIDRGEGDIYQAQLEEKEAQSGETVLHIKTPYSPLYAGYPRDSFDLPSQAYWDEQARLNRPVIQPRIPKKTVIPTDTHDSLSIILQAYNAGPGAVIVYDGDVPYRDTIAYVNTILNHLDNPPRSSEFDPYITKYAAQYGLEPDLVRAVIKAESNFKSNARSKADARGLMQITYPAWKEAMNRMGLDWSYSKYCYDPEKNIEVGCNYLAWLQNSFYPRFQRIKNEDIRLSMNK